MKNKPIIIVGGEPNSIFLEIYLKSLKKNNFKKSNILIASKKLLLSQMKYFKYSFKINTINENQINYKKIKKNEINIIDVELKFKKPFEKITRSSNKYIEECFRISLKLLRSNNFSGLINGPISKKSFLNGKFLGITEYIANKTNKKQNIVAMLIYNKKLSVSPITTHLPVKDIHKNITRMKIIKHVKLINNFYKKRLNRTPKIAVTGLNPHCESNYNFSEEDKVIKPALAYLNRNKFNIAGPFAADTIFMKNNLDKYDVVIGMFHDQVLTPLKALFGFNAINITLGLPFIRISPDHGPNIKMLGMNKSNPQSLIEALKFLDN
jgi:4-hydroxythreonine-4-phosphate dehydrogenase